MHNLLQDIPGAKRANLLVKTKEWQFSLQQKAKDLNDKALFLRIQGFGDTTIDMVTYNVCYHRIRMNRYMSKRPATSLNSDMADDNDDTFNYSISKITQPLLNGSVVFLLTTLRDIYWSILQEHGNQY